jgi:membrane-associated phospholipid phosphatase
VRAGSIGVALWLVLVGAADVAGVIGLWRFFVHSEHGQVIDTIALTGNSIGQRRVGIITDTVLNTMSVVSIAAAIAAVVFIALLRGRIALALVSLLFIAGANLTTQVLKAGLYRPMFGVDKVRDQVGNSFPSGHTTAAAAVAVALVFVLPARVRGVGAVLGAAFAGLVGVATLSAGWHRPSDAVAAMLVVGGWACAAALVMLLIRRSDVAADREGGHWGAVVFLALAGIGLLVVALLALRWTNEVLQVPPDELSRRRLFAAYAGGMAGIAGTACLMTAVVTATVHVVVPRSAPVAATSRPDEYPGRTSDRGH